jgi:hypothetical protein
MRIFYTPLLLLSNHIQRARELKNWGAAFFADTAPRKKGNGFLVDIPGKTLLKVGQNIEAVHSDPAFAKPADDDTALSPLGKDKKHMEIYTSGQQYLRYSELQGISCLW